MLKKKKKLKKYARTQTLNILRLSEKTDTTKEDCTNRTYNSYIDNTKEDSIKKKLTTAVEHW